jgi:major type 1 subunit fimbrin (pilin)
MKKILAAAVALGMSSIVMAAPAIPNNTIEFTGEIINGSCGISADSSGQEVKLGSVQAGQFSGVGTQSTATDFNIALVGCSTAVAKNAYFTFSGQAAEGNAELFSVSEAQGVGIRLAGYKNGEESSAPVVLADGNNVVKFSAKYEATSTDVVPGQANATANFVIAYR